MLQYFLAGIFLLISVLAAAGLIWQFFNTQGKRRRGSQKSSKNKDGSHFRDADQEKLNRHERQVMRRAKVHIKSGEVMAGATLYESIGRSREAIQILEENGFIHDACKILLRMNRPNRAGVVFARNGMWDRAIDCFRIAGMTLEVAKCYKELKNYLEAAPLYAEAGRMKEAAFCYREGGQLEKSATILMDIDEIDAAVKLYDVLVANHGMNPFRVQLSQRSIQSLLKYCLSGKVSKTLVGILIGKGKFPDLVFALQSSEKYEVLNEVFTVENDVGFTQLIADQRFRDDFGVQTARLLAKHGQVQYAGILFERGFQFVEAAESFERCGELERAAYCYQRSGDSIRSEKLRAKIGGQKSQESGSKKIRNLADTDPSKELSGSLVQSQSYADASSKPEQKSSELEVGKSRLTELAPLTNKKKNENSLSEHELDDFYIFSQTNFIQHLPENIKLDVFKIGRFREYSEDEQVLKFGSTPNGFYTIISGAVKCFKVDDEQQRQFVDMLNPSDSFGEVWLLSGYLAPMIFQASTHVRLMYFPANDLFRYLEDHGQVLHSIYLNFSSRLVAQFVEQPSDVLEEEADVNKRSA